MEFLTLLMQRVSKASVVKTACDIDGMRNVSYIGDTGSTEDKRLGGDTGGTMETISKTLLAPERSIASLENSSARFPH